MKWFVWVNGNQQSKHQEEIESDKGRLVWGEIWEQILSCLAWSGW